MNLDTTGRIRLALLSGTAALTLLALIAGLGLRLNDQAHAATPTVNVGQTNGGGGGADEYNSAAITIPEGDTVDFNWFDGVHDVTAYVESSPGTPEWQSPLMVSTATFSRTFNTASVVTYYCTIHASRADAAPGVVDANIASGDQMVGKVIVEAAAADTPTPTDAPPADTPTDTPAAATATPTDVPPTATPTDEPPTETPAEATATAAPPTATATEAPAEATPTATDVPSATPLPRTLNIEAGNEWFGDAGNQNGADEITVRAGDTVQWNVVEGVHTIYECGANWSRANGCADAAWSSDILQTGDIISRRFNEAGTFYYLCTLHPLTMRGVIAVEGNAPPSAVTSTPPPGATPTSTASPVVSSPTPNSKLPVALANSGYGPLSQESARPDSPLGRAITIAAAAVALIAAALMLKEVAWSIRN